MSRILTIAFILAIGYVLGVIFPGLGHKIGL